jgi:hypothetical protein
VATNSPYGNYPVPTGGDSNDVPAALSNFIKSAEADFIGRFANAADRDAKIASAISAGVTGLPRRGNICWLNSPGRHYSYDGTQWKPLVPITEYVGGVIIGTTYDGVSPIIRQEFSSVVTTSSAGGFATIFPQPFPNGLFSVTLMPGDAATNLGIIQPIIANHTLTSGNGVAFDRSTSTEIISTIIRVETKAVGW